MRRIEKQMLAHGSKDTAHEHIHFVLIYTTKSSKKTVDLECKLTSIG